jgi:hypothetical protein
MFVGLKEKEEKKVTILVCLGQFWANLERRLVSCLPLSKMLYQNATDCVAFLNHSPH